MPLVIAVRNYGSQGFFRYDIGEHKVVRRVWGGTAVGMQPRMICRERVAISIHVGRPRRRLFFSWATARRSRLCSLEKSNMFNSVVVFEVTQTEAPDSFPGRGYPETAANDKSLAVVVHGLDEIPPLGFAGGGGSYHTRRHVNFAGPQGISQSRGNADADLHRAGVAQYGGGNRPAKVDVESGVFAVDQVTETGNSIAASADEVSAAANFVQAADTAVGCCGITGIRPVLWPLIIAGKQKCDGQQGHYFERGF